MEPRQLNFAGRKKHQLTIGVAWLLAALPAWSYALPPEFTAEYHLEMYQTSLARATYGLKHTDNGVTMTQSTKPIGLVALFRKDRIDVRSDMSLHNGRLGLDRYSYIYSGTDKNKNIRLSIDRHTDEVNGPGLHVSGVDGGNPVDIDTKQEFWDPLSIQVPLMMQAENFGAPHEISVFMSGEVRTYLFSHSGDEKIEIDGKVYDCVTITGAETERDRKMIIWLARGLHYLPVKIQQWKDGEVNSTVLLDTARFPEDHASSTDASFDDDL
jgi:Protein of unknown function (DUF3108)